MPATYRYINKETPKLTHTYTIIGATFPVKAELYAFGARWNAGRKVWEYKTIGRRLKRSEAAQVRAIGKGKVWVANPYAPRYEYTDPKDDPTK